MTKEMLERYCDTCEEIHALDKEADSAKGFGESQRVVFLHAERYGRLVEEKRQVEAFVWSLPWGKRILVQAVMRYGPHWDVIRREIHSMKSANALRMEYNRIFENNL